MLEVRSMTFDKLIKLLKNKNINKQILKEIDCEIDTITKNTCETANTYKAASSW